MREDGFDHERVAQEIISYVVRSPDVGAADGIAEILRREYGDLQTRIDIMKDTYMWEHQCRIDLERSKQFVEQARNALKAKLAKAREALGKEARAKCVWCGVSNHALVDSKGYWHRGYDEEANVIRYACGAQEIRDTLKEIE